MIIKRKKMKKGMMTTLMMLWILMWGLTHQLAHQLSLVTLTSNMTLMILQAKSLGSFLHMMPLITISSNPPVRKLVSCRNGRKVSTTLWLSYLQLYRHKPSQMPIVRRQQRRYCRSCSIMYVCLHFTILLPNILQALHVYGLHGISVSGIILGANLVAPSTVLHPSFFGPEPKFVNVLQNMLWGPQEVQQYLLSTTL